ncbi:MAG: PQQ-dependent sugar dehydrogenase, partial [Patulibacter sp.]|nr:PQQ-dependent sugar dehydrogenase [Patulibacter sp.]
MRPLGSTLRHALRALVLALFAVVVLTALPGAALAHDDTPVVEEPVIPGIDWATDFQIAPNGDVYVAQQGGTIFRYRRVADSTVAHPRYDLDPQTIWSFDVTEESDRGLVGISLDGQWAAGQHYLYALITRGSTHYVEDAPNGNPNGLRRTGALVRIKIPDTGLPAAADVTTILGKDAPADPNSSCKPYTLGQAAASGETDAAPNGVKVQYPRNVDGSPGTSGSKVPDFKESNIYPDGDLSTRADGAYDCLPSDESTHGLGTVASAPDGSLYLSIGDASPYLYPSIGSLRAFNLESYAGKVLHVDRSGHGLASHPFCPTETDLTRVCTKIWAIGIRNGFRFSLLPADSKSGGQPVLSLGDVGNGAMESLSIVHPGDDLGWPCWEGDRWNVEFADPSSPSALASAWGGPALKPTGPGHTTCENLTAPGSLAAGNPKPRSDISPPSLEYLHEQRDPADQSGYPGAAIVGGPYLHAVAGSDPAVALPAAWNGSLVFGDYVRGWIYRISPDPNDPNDTQNDGGLLWPADQGRGPQVRTDYTGSHVPDPILDRIAEPPPVGDNGLPSTFYRLTTREGPDGTLWYMGFGNGSTGAGLYRLRTPATHPAQIESATGACDGSNSAITLTAADAGPDATYRWDIDGDGEPDPGRTTRSITVPYSDIAALGWGAHFARVEVTVGGETSIAARYVCAGPTPKVSITDPKDGASVVLGQPVVITATRPAGDAAATGIPDADLHWHATTVHGSSHEHLLTDQAAGTFTTVNGQRQTQLTLTPDAGHELGSYTLVRIYAPQADGNTTGQSIRLYPKPVSVTLASSPAGATISMSRDVTPSVASPAPASFQAAAGYVTSISAGADFTDASGRHWLFDHWSDGSKDRVRGWRVPADGGTAPTAVYVADPNQPPPTPTPTPTPGPTPTPTPTPIVTPTPT